MQTQLSLKELVKAFILGPVIVLTLLFFVAVFFSAVFHLSSSDLARPLEVIMIIGSFIAGLILSRSHEHKFEIGLSAGFGTYIFFLLIAIGLLHQEPTLISLLKGVILLMIPSLAGAKLTEYSFKGTNQAPAPSALSRYWAWLHLLWILIGLSFIFEFVPWFLQNPVEATVGLGITLLITVGIAVVVMRFGFKKSTALDS